MRIDGNTILMTGGGSGIGAALARRFHDLGNTVIVTGRRREALEDTADGRPNIVCEVLDVDDPALNVLINNAGIMRSERLDGARDLSDAAQTIATNLIGPIRMIDALIDHLVARGDGTIVNVTSGLAFVPLVSAPTYSATKAAIHSYTVSLRHALKGRVEVIELAPPGVQTGLTPGQETRAGYMPLDDYADAVIVQFAADPTPGEILVERSRMLRTAEIDGRFDDVLAMVNPAS